MRETLRGSISNVSVVMIFISKAKNPRHGSQNGAVFKTGAFKTLSFRFKSPKGEKNRRLLFWRGHTKEDCLLFNCYVRSSLYYWHSNCAVRLGVERAKRGVSLAIPSLCFFFLFLVLFSLTLFVCPLNCYCLIIYLGFSLFPFRSLLVTGKRETERERQKSTDLADVKRSEENHFKGAKKKIKKIEKWRKE